MKKLVSIMIISLYLVSTTELYQFLKIPILVEHFKQHKDQNKNTTLKSFLEMHYQGHVKDSDYAEDLQLPFVSHAQHMVVTFTLSPFYYHQYIEIHFVESQVLKTLYKSIFYNKEIQNSIWQPPKFC